MPVFRGLLFAFAASVAVLVVLYLLRGERKYLRWAGRLFVALIGGALAFFALLIVQKFT